MLVGWMLVASVVMGVFVAPMFWVVVGLIEIITKEGND